MQDRAPAEFADPAVLRAEARLAALRELTEIGMAFARALGRKAETEEDLTAPAESFTRVSRAVRLTITLEEKTDRALRDLQAGVVREAEVRRAESARRALADAGFPAKCVAPFSRWIDFAAGYTPQSAWDDDAAAGTVVIERLWEHAAELGCRGGDRAGGGAL